MEVVSKNVKMLQNGQETGLRYFMTEFGDALRFYAYKITRNQEVSEEIVSEAFFKLWKNKTKVESVGSIKSFLYLVTRNACFDFLKSAHKKNISFWGEEILDINPPDKDILTQIIYVELIGLIAVELKKLPKQQAEVFEMSYLRGMGTEEICEALNTTTGNVYYAKSKALSKIRMVLKEKDISLYTALLSLIFIH